MEQKMEIDKSVSTPLYLQIAAALKAEINSEKYKPGDRLPRELSLAKYYKVSRITVRSALDLLSEEEMITKVQGKGTFVSNKKKTVLMNSVQGFYSLLVQSGGEINTQLKKITIGQTTNEIREILEIKKQTNILTLERLYIVNQQPFALTKTYFFKEIYLNEEDATSTTAYGILVKKLNEVPYTAKYNLSIINCPKDISRILNLDEGLNIQILKRTTFNEKGNPIEYTIHYIHPEHCNLEFSLAQNNKTLNDLRIINS